MKNSPEELSIEEIKRRITSRLGIEEDELKTLYPTEERIREFYAKEVLTLKTVENAEDDWPEDDFKLNSAQRDELNSARSRKGEEQAQKDKTKQFVSQEREKIRREDEFLPAEQSHLPVKERVSLKDIADAAKSLQDLNLDGDEGE